MQGLVYIFTGEGKGKTSAALGMALRAVCDGRTVVWIAWYKEASWDVSEYRAVEFLGDSFTMYIGGKGFYLEHAKPENVSKVGNVRTAKTNKQVVVDKVSPEEHRKAAQGSLQKMAEIIEAQDVDVLICDELCQAVDEHLVDLSEVLQLIHNRRNVHLVLTGRHCPQELIGVADTVTEMKKIKHAYDQGTMALKGLDF